MQNLQVITIKKSIATNKYICEQPVSYDFYLLYLLFAEKLSQPYSPVKGMTSTKKNRGIEFCKNTTMQCLATNQLFLHKNHGHIELFSIHDLKENHDLNLPAFPKFIMTAKNFINFMIQKELILKQQPQKFFIALDQQGHAHISTNLQTLHKVSFFTALQKKLVSFFSKQTP